jgi:hypothetical protein
VRTHGGHPFQYGEALAGFPVLFHEPSLSVTGDNNGQVEKIEAMIIINATINLHIKPYGCNNTTIFSPLQMASKPR